LIYRISIEANRHNLEFSRKEDFED